jgi:Holliday junction resolvasome RuvABC DNA-binding subunit
MFEAGVRNGDTLIVM